jgi:hypothetical protein
MSVYNYNDIFKNNYATNIYTSLPVNKLISIETNIDVPKGPLTSKTINTDTNRSSNINNLINIDTNRSTNKNK